MSEEDEQEHISLDFTKGMLPPLQRKIVLHLAKTEPKTINETVKALKGSYKSYWVAFNSLEKKQLVDKVRIKSYRGQDYPQFWLTSAGVLVALFEGVDSEILLERTLKIYPDDKNIQVILELTPVFGKEVFKIAFVSLLTKGKIEPKDWMLIITSELQSDFGGKKPEELMDMLKKHPQAYENAKKYAKIALDRIKKLESLFE